MRFIHPVTIRYDQAIFVAVIGLIVNGVSVLILGGHGGGHAHHHHHDDHSDAHHHDHNLRSAYLHVLADAVTSLLAIFALLVGKYFGWAWMDPAMGLVGTLLVGRWSLGLLRSSAHVLLDHQAPESLRRSIHEAIESSGRDRIQDLHVWSIAPGLHAAILSISSESPRTIRYYRDRLPGDAGLVHVTIELHEETGGGDALAH